MKISRRWVAVALTFSSASCLALSALAASSDSDWNSTVITRIFTSHGYSESAPVVKKDPVQSPTDAEFAQALKDLSDILAWKIDHVRNFSQWSHVYFCSQCSTAQVEYQGHTSLFLSVQDPKLSWIRWFSANPKSEPVYAKFLHDQEVYRTEALTKALAPYYPLLQLARAQACDSLGKNPFDPKTVQEALQAATGLELSAPYHYASKPDKDKKSEISTESLRFDLKIPGYRHIEIERIYKKSVASSFKVTLDDHPASGESVLASMVPGIALQYGEQCDFKGAERDEFRENGKLYRRLFYNASGDLSRTAYADRDVLTLDQIYSDPAKPGQISLAQAKRVAARTDRVVVAVLDGGVDYNHPSLAYKILRRADGKIEGWNYEANDDRPYDYDDYSLNILKHFDHGTHVAGIASAGSDDIAILPLRYPRAYTQWNGFYEAVKLAHAKGARIMNISLGSPNRKEFEPLEKGMIEFKDILFVVAAGNEAGATIDDPYPSPDKGNDDVNPAYPASFIHPNVVAVASVDRTGKLSDFSSFGPKTVAIAAPGESIDSLTPEGDHGKKSGTSMATPYVVNVAAKMLLANPKLTPPEIIRILEKTSSPNASLSGKIRAGVVNVDRAIRAAKEGL